MTMLDHALAHAARGWAVFPLAPGSKVPLIAGGRGFKDATRDAAVIREWWARCPEANVGIATGSASGFDVLDIDGLEGAQTVDAMPPLPPTATVRTPKGEHVYFAHRDGLKNAVRFAPGLDIRTDGGYVVGPGSVVNGHAYALADAPAAPWPETLWALCATPARPAGNGHAAALGGGTPYGRRAAEGLLAEVLAAGEGARNDTLNRCAFRAGRLFAGGELPDIAQALIAAGVGTGLTQAEAERTVRGAWIKGTESPAEAPPRALRALPPEVEHRPLDEDAPGSTEPPPEPDPAEASPEPPDERLTDLGNARRLVRLHGADLRHTAGHGWLVWDGVRWLHDDTGQAIDRAKNAVETLLQDAAEADADQRKPLIKHAMASQSNRAIQATLNLAASEPGVSMRAKDFDSHPGMLNTPGGVVELATGNIRPCDRNLLITRTTAARFDPHAVAPMWSAFLEQVLPCPDVRAYVQRYAGYSLSGTKNAQCFAVLYGTGANGKSTLLDVLCAVLGDYAVSAPFDTFLTRKTGQASNDLARLAGARLVRCGEPEDGAILSEGTVKQATGGEPLTVRFLHKEFFEFRPEFALWMSGNHQPRVKGTDHGIWRRIHLVPFPVKIEAPDEGLKDRLLTESEGILAWAVSGYAAFLAVGLSPPKTILEATAEYRKEQDTLGGFFDDCCVLGDERECYSHELRKVYTAWCKSGDEYAVSQRVFTARLKERSCTPVRVHSGRKWRGIGIRQGQYEAATERDA